MSTPSTPLVSGGGKKKRGGCCGGNAVDESAQRMEEGSEHTPLSIKAIHRAGSVAKGSAVMVREQWHKMTHYLARHLFENVEAQVEDAIIANIPVLISELTKFHLESPLGNRQLGFVCGALLLVCGLINLTNNALTMCVAPMVIDVTLLVIGVLSLLTEYKVSLMPTRVARYLQEEWRFLFKPFGRPLLYIFGGCFIISQSKLIAFPPTGSDLMGFENFLVGFVVCVLSCIIIYNTWVAQQDLEMLRRKHVDFDILSKEFYASDANGDGELDTSEFVSFLHRVGLRLSHNDLETALLELDVDHDGKVSWTEFVDWHSKSEDIFV